MVNTNQGNTASTPNPGEQNSAPRDWWSEREKWREERHKWRMEMRTDRHRWPFHGVAFGLTLVLLGVLFLLNQTGAISGDTWWQGLLIGLGGISIVDGVARYFSHTFRWGIFSKITGGIVMILIGALLMAGLSEWWPIVLIVAGVAFMSRFFWRRTNVLP